MYIGNQPLYQSFVTDTFSGNGSTTAFTMSVAPANTPSVLVAVSGVLQDPSTYSVSGTTLTFSAAPPSGTSNISVRYLGIPASGVTTTAYRTVTEFTATASQTTFTPSSYTPGYINVYQNGALLGSADYTATNGTTVVLAVGATAGDLIVTESFYVSSVLNAIPSIGGSVNNTYLDVSSANGTGAMRLPVGTTAQRPSGVTGLIRQNSTTGYPEWYDATTSNWVQFNQGIPYLISYLVVAGGGGGGGTYSGNSASGGGGAGGLLASTTYLSTATTYTITVGAGGAGGTNASSGGGPGAGSNSTLGALATAIGGGGGASTFASPTSGGSGGGGRSNGSGAAGTSGQGFAGGGSSNQGGGGGGGASAVGGTGSGNTGGTGGAGTASSITGSSITYAGGGGGGANSGGTGGGGGSGGGGTGSTGSGSAGTTNLGGGGGGCGDNSNGGAGGSGVVILSIPTVNYTGVVTGSPTVTTSGSNTIVKFTSSGTYTA